MAEGIDMSGIRENKRAGGSSRGYSLVELLVVLGLAAILLSIGVPALIGQMNHLRLTRSVRDIAIELNAARLKAIAHNNRYNVHFTLNAAPAVDTYRLQYFDGAADWIDEPTHETKEVEPGIDIVSPGASFDIDFWPQGKGTAKSICVQYTASDRMKIDVTEAVGRITIENGC